MQSTDFSTAEVIVDEMPMTGHCNMAMDAAMLQLGASRSISVIRIYQWSCPTISLGYFQGTSERHDSPFPQLPTVKRLSGGGAILHDRELTYSCVIPAVHPIREDPSELYRVVHLCLIRLLNDCGVPCCLRSDFRAGQRESEIPGDGSPSDNSEPFLCFLRQNPNDIVHTSGIKIVGSAQRRRKGITLQHGSILLSASKITPGIPGIQQLCPLPDIAKLRSHLGPTIAAAVSSQWQLRSYTPEEETVCAEIMKQNEDCDTAESPMNT